jgi:signal transduction histidine kinase
LRGLDERVTAAGGVLDVSSTPGRGTTITAVAATPAGEGERAMEIARS